MNRRVIHHRRAFRHAVRVPFQVVRERDFKLVADQSIDLSTDGALVSAKADVLTGEPLIVSFWLCAERRWIDAEATVTRVVHGRRPTDPGRALGIAFRGVSDDDRRVIFRSLRAAPPAGLVERRSSRRLIQ